MGKLFKFQVIIFFVFIVLLLAGNSERSSVHAQATVPSQCNKLGINFAVAPYEVPSLSTQIDRAKKYNMGYALVIAIYNDSFSITSTGDVFYDIINSSNHQITPILRICTYDLCKNQDPTTSFKNPAEYVEFMEGVAQRVQTRLGNSNFTFYVIAGQNEPLDEPWLDGLGSVVPGPNVNYDLVAQKAAPYMNSVITGVNNSAYRSNIKLLSPAHNITHPRFDEFVTSMNNYGANWAGLDGIAGNAYNLHGYQVDGVYRETISSFVSRLREAGFTNYDLYLTEIGKYESDENPSWGTPVPDETAKLNLSTQIDLLREDSKIKAMLLFNSFGTNPDTSFDYNELTDAELEYVIKNKCLSYGQIVGLSPDLNVINLSGQSLESDSSIEGGGEYVRLTTNTGMIISEVYTDFNGDQDWSGVTAEVDGISGKSVVSNLTAAPGTASSHTLYIPKVGDSNTPYICPNATAIGQVSMGCSGGYHAINFEVVTVNGQDYFKVSGLTGTGGLGTYQNATALTLTPNSSNASATQEVVMSYTATGGFVSGDQIVISWENGAGMSLANTCSAPTTDADSDSTNDGSGSVSGNQYTYTFTSSTTQTDIGLCVNVTAYSSQGTYSVTMNDDNAAFAAALYYVEGDGEVFVIANIAPTLSFNIRDIGDSVDTNSCDLGNVNTATLSPDGDNVDDGDGECGYALAIGTNAVGGFQAQIVADGPLNNATSSLADIANGIQITSGTEGYGIDNITVATTGRNPGTGLYDQSVTLDGTFGTMDHNVPLSATNFISYSDGVQYIAGSGASDVTIVMHGLGVASGTPSGYYDQVITYTVTAAF